MAELREMAAQVLREAGPGAVLTVWAAGASPEHAASVAALGGRLILAEATMRRRAADASSTDPKRIEAAAGGPSRVRVLRCHVKAAVAVGPHGAAGWLTSANLNRLTREEYAERLSADDARALGAVADRLFAVCPAGIAPDPSRAYRAMKDAMREARAAGLRVHQDGGVFRPAMRGDGLVLVDRAGAFEAIRGAVFELGDGVSIDAVTWALDEDHVDTLAGWLRSGRLAGLRVAVPARWGRRGASAELASRAASELAGLRWCPSHAKVAVVRGADGRVCTITGGANFGGGGSLDTVRIQWGEDAAREAQAFLDGLSVEASPELVAQPSLFGPPGQSDPLLRALDEMARAGEQIAMLLE